MKKFNHQELIEMLNNIDINRHHSLVASISKLNQGEELKGTPFDKEDIFHLNPIFCIYDDNLLCSKFHWFINKGVKYEILVREFCCMK